MAHIKGNNPAGQTISWAQGVTNEQDLVEGNVGADWIFTQGGDDIIKGGGGADWINGGAGDDTVLYGDSLVGVEVNLATGKGKGGTAEGDTLVDIENVVGSDFNDKLIGDAEDNELQGGKGNDVLKGGGGYDVLLGGTGDDFLEVDGIADVVNGGEGRDTLVINGPHGIKVSLIDHFFETDTPENAHFHRQHRNLNNIEDVIGSEFDDKITGDNAANMLMGRDGEDELFGLAGNDTLIGGAGSDLLNGGAGADRLTSGTGHDIFQYSSDLDSYWIAGKPSDVIEDFFKGVDKIDLSALGLTYGDLKIVNNVMIEGEAGAYFGYDENNNGVFDTGEFSVAVKIDGGAPALNQNDFLF